MTDLGTRPHTVERAAHDLALAALFGGVLVGKTVFNPSLGVLGSKTERGRLGATFWNRSNAINASAFAVAVATWLPERRRLLKRGTEGRGLVLAKDVLMGVAGAAGLATLIVQAVLYQQAPEGAVPLETGGKPAPEAPPRAYRLQRIVSALGSVDVALFAGLICATAIVRHNSER
jgi:hypothetical protein